MLDGARIVRRLILAVRSGSAWPDTTRIRILFNRSFRPPVTERLRSFMRRFQKPCYTKNLPPVLIAKLPRSFV
jgi:hypothetical protein